MMFFLSGYFLIISITTYNYSPKLYHANSMNTGPDFNFRVYFFNVPPIPGYGSYWNYSYVMLIIKKYPDKKNIIIHPFLF
jgi:hypothetical protein